MDASGQRIIEAAKKWAAAMVAAIACKDRDNYWRVSSAEEDARHELYAAVKAAEGGYAMTPSQLQRIGELYLSVFHCEAPLTQKEVAKHAHDKAKLDALCREVLASDESKVTEAAHA